MHKVGYLWVLCTCIFGSAFAEVAPPGINPNVYQTDQRVPHGHQPVHPNQYAPPHQHAPVNMQGQIPHSQQQMHVPGNVEVPHHSGPVPRVPQQVQHQGQVPVQNVPYQNPQSGHAPVGSVPQHAGQVPQQPHGTAGGHHHHPDQPQVLNADIKGEKEHIGEHFDIPVDTSKMTEQELQFHYFKMHDSDGNNKLDGCELIKSLIHWHEQGRNQPDAGPNHPQPKIFTDDELSNLIDPIINTDDLDKDGYIDYAEFMHAQTKGSVKEEL